MAKVELSRRYINYIGGSKGSSYILLFWGVPNVSKKCESKWLLKPPLNKLIRSTNIHIYLWGCPQSLCPCHLPRPKLVKKTSRHRNSWQPMRWTNMHKRGSIFFPFGQVRGVFFGVPNGFPSSPQWFPTCFPSSHCVLQHVSNSTSLCPHMLCPKFYSCNLYINAPPKEEECTIYTILGLSTAWFSFLWWTNQRCPSQRKNICRLGVPTTN